MAPGRRAVAIAAVGQAFEAVIGEFPQQNGIVEQGYVVSLDGKGQGFDERRFGFGAGVEAANRQAQAVEGVDIGFANAVGFRPDDLRLPFFDDAGDAAALEFPAYLIEAVEGDHFSISGVDDGDGGVVLAASPINAGDIGMARLRLVIRCRSGRIGDAAEDLAAVVGEFGFVFGFPDMLSGVVLDAFQFGGIDEFGLGGAEMESSPFVLQRVEAVAMAFPKPVAALGCAEEAGAAAGSGEHGSDDIVPNMGGHPGGFVEDGEIEAVAAQFIGVMGAADGDHTAFLQINAALGLVNGDVF